MLKETARPKTGGEALLMALKVSGIDYIFANAGTDFPPIIEGLARLSEGDVPAPVTVPHRIAIRRTRVRLRKERRAASSQRSSC